MNKNANKTGEQITAAGLAEYLGCPLSGEGRVRLTGYASPESAEIGDLIYIAGKDPAAKLVRTRASTAIVPPDTPWAQGGPSLIHSAHPQRSFIKALELFFFPWRPPAGIHPTSVVAPTARIAPGAAIGALCSIGEGAEISEGAVLFPLVSVYPRAKIGAQAVLHSHVSIREDVVIGPRTIIHDGAVIGADGFGYIQDAEGRHTKIPQTGRVIIEEDVEIGANVTIDRGSLDATVIGRGTKIDNLVMIAHNVSLGRHIIIAAQSGVAGSTTVGNHVMMGGQVGVVDHAEIGDGAIVNAKSGVTNSVPPGVRVAGNPHMDITEWRKARVSLPKLYDLIKEFKRLKRRVEELEARRDKD
jgi:UDP-3-O-[3-hydroxymyristoyl] glucosamine N-acyltransferase